MKPRSFLPRRSKKKLAHDAQSGRRVFSTITKKTRVKARNPKRAASAFAFAYHSRERKAFVRSLGCVYCTMIAPLFGTLSAGTSDNAHTGKKPGKGLKSHYTSIVPLCRSHHRMYDERVKRLGDADVRAAIESLASQVEARWRAHSGESA